MKNLSKTVTNWARAILLALFASGLTLTPAHADVAPPESPPGTNIVPGTDTTQVRMLAEVVTLTVLSYPADGKLGQAKTEASFLMRNLGSSAENVEVRFPLTFLTGATMVLAGFPRSATFKSWLMASRSRPGGLTVVLPLAGLPTVNRPGPHLT